MYDVDDGADDTSPVASDPVQQTVQPSNRTLAVRVQERQDLPLGGPGTQQSRLHQTYTLFRTNYSC